MENPNKMDDLGIPLFLETPISTKMKNMMLIKIEQITVVTSAKIYTPEV